ncbi:MAG: hypothetical protein ACYDGN_17530 [Acidimicrobiales bacterium]
MSPRKPPQPRIGIGKDAQEVLYMLPSRAEELLWPVAERINQFGLVLLLAKYMLSPGQAVTASVGEDGLHVEGFDEPLVLEPEDRPGVEEWLGRRKRSHSAQAVRNVLSAKLKPALVVALAAHQARTGDWTGWRIRLRPGVKELRRTGIELNAEAGGHDESTHRELMHSQDADVDDTLRMLTRRARRVLGQAAESEARLVQELMEARVAGLLPAHPRDGAV